MRNNNHEIYNTMNKYDQIFNEKLGELMKEVEFYCKAGLCYEFSKIDLSMVVTNSLKYKNEISLDCTIGEYISTIELFKEVTPITSIMMPEMFIGLQAAMAATPYQMLDDADTNTYRNFKAELVELKRHWDTIAAPYIEQAQKYAQAIAKQDISAEKRLSGLQPKKNKLITLP